jgi:hypothetical protein
MNEMATPSHPLHEPHYDILAAAVSGTAATMLTLLAMLGGGVTSSLWLKTLFDAQLLVIELALIAGVSALIRGNESHRKTFAHIAAPLLVTGAVLLGLGAAIF